MKTRDFLAEWRNFIRQGNVILEGGNATAIVRGPDGKPENVMWKGRKAQARPIVFDQLVSRSDFTRDVKDMIRKIDDIHRRAFGEGLYSIESRDEMLDSGYTFMGSSEFLFAPSSDISDEEYTAHKKKTGDIDLLIDETKIPSLFALLNELSGKQLTSTTKLIGHNKLTEAQIRGEQINAIFEYKSNGRDFLFQIDFVFVPFNEEGRPNEEEKFLRGSTWEDITEGIKGIGHKLLLQALGSRINTIPWGSALIATGASRPDKIRLKTKLPNITDIRVGLPGITPIDLEPLEQYVDVKKIPKSFYGKVSSEEVERFINSLNNDRAAMLNQILNKEGLAQNQTVALLTTFIVHSPTVEDFQLDSYFDSFSSLMSFSMGRGLSTRYKKEDYQVNGKDVYRYLEFAEREEKFRKAEDVFEAIFKNRPTAEDARDIASYLGLLRVIQRYLSPEAKIAAYDGLFYYCYQAENFMSAHDIQDDLIPKEKIISAYENAVSESRQSQKYKNKEALIGEWIKEYEIRLANDA